MQNIRLNKIKQVLDKYLEGKTSLEEEQTLVDFFQSDDIPDELKIYQEEFNHYSYSRQQQAGAIVQQTIDQLPLKSPKRQGMIFDQRTLQIAAAIALMIISFFAGSELNSDTDIKNEMTTLKAEVIDLKETTIKMMLQQESSHERIQALVLASQLEPVGDELLKNILRILNEDKNPLVRTVALDFLETYKNTELMKSTLIQAFQQQEVLSLQLELLRMIKELDDDTLNSELKSMLDGDKLAPEIKEEMKSIVQDENSISI